MLPCLGNVKIDQILDIARNAGFKLRIMSGFEHCFIEKQFLSLSNNPQMMDEFQLELRIKVSLLKI
jgi:hypothetical protein